MTQSEINDILKLVGAALVGALVSILTTFFSAWQANRRLKIEIQEKHKDRVSKFMEKLSDKVINSHVNIYQELTHFKECMFFQNDYLTGEWFWGLEQPADLFDMNTMFTRIGKVITANEIWLSSDCTRQLNRLRWELQQGREVELRFARNEDDDDAKKQLFQVYEKVIAEIDNSLTVIRKSVGINSFDNMFRSNS